MTTHTGDLLEEAKSLRDELVALRRAIHLQPESGFAEHKTAALIAERMRALGAQVHVGVARTGVVAELGASKPIVAVRADMDALPLHEATGLPFASQVSGMMHACGHDAHVACALGAAILLARRELPGTVRFLFQPSEEQKDAEGWSGAMRMLAEGALTDVSAAIALHTRKLPAGMVGITAGPALAGNDTVQIAIRGRASHAAHPEEGIDAVLAAAHIVMAAQTIVSRRTRPGVPAVVSLTTINGGVKENVIADRVEIRGTVRNAGPEHRTQLLGDLERALDAGRALGADCTLEVNEGYPVTHNDASIAASIREAAASILGPTHVVDLPFDTWAEDFGYMTAAVPGAMFWLGVTGPAVPDPTWHSPTFDIDENALPVGAAVLAASALRLLETQK
ncbi:MAG TPA: M20 family metallopeptidase [Vicinamibacterales bacterium]|nr:M20 family metallopeptidase [Vicinamibacterales bacterium]